MSENDEIGSAGWWILIGWNWIMKPATGHSRHATRGSPDLGAWRGTSNTVSRALTLIGEGALDGEAVDALAERLGVGERQLRRLFRQHLGASPIAVAQTRRVLFAKQLIVETTMPMAEVALAAGFNSIRRFNATFHTLYQRSPSELRRSSSAVGEQTGTEGITLMLPYAPP